MKSGARWSAFTGHRANAYLPFKLQHSGHFSPLNAHLQGIPSFSKGFFQGQVVALNWVRELETSVLMVWHKERRISEALHHFMEFVRHLKDD
jgi:hypothetical protein